MAPRMRIDYTEETGRTDLYVPGMSGGKHHFVVNSGRIEYHGIVKKKPEKTKSFDVTGADTERIMTHAHDNFPEDFSYLHNLYRSLCQRGVQDG